MHRIVLISDCESTRERMAAELDRRKSAVEIDRLVDIHDSPEDLARGHWDAIIVDWSMSGADPREALAAARLCAPEIPLLAVGDSTDEEDAADAMRAGARDYVYLDRISRLSFVLGREMSETTDRAERSRLEADRRELALRYRRLVESGMLGVTIADATGRVLEANDAFLQMLGYDAADLAAGTLDWVRLTPPDWREANRAIGEQLRARGFSRPSVKEYLRKDGTRAGALVGVALLPGERAISISVDVSEQRRAEEARREAEARYSRLCQSGIIGVVVADLEGDIVEVNDACLGMLGFTRDDLDQGAVHWPSLTPEEWLHTDAAAFDQLASTGVATPWEKEMVRGDGTRLPVLVGMALLGGTRYLAVITDLTERKRVEQSLRRTEEQLRQAQKMEAIGRLAGGVAHDFNNLLTVILSYSDLLLDDLPEREPIRADLEEIRAAASRAGGLTRQLLAFSRQQVLQPRRVDVAEIVSGTERMLRRLLGEDVEVATTLDREGSTVLIDPGQLEQVIMNLAVNARDAMPGGGKLTIETSRVELDDARAVQFVGARAGTFLRLGIGDTGAGMSADTLARIFEPFFTTKPAGQGTGLGLSTVFGIVQQSGGFISVDSEEGRGTTFEIFLPLAEVVQAIPPTGTPMATAASGQETILLVEDDDRVRVVARTILRKHGYHVLEAANGGDAVLICEQHPTRIDLLLSDVVMPRMSGPQLAARLLAIRPAMKVLFMSGFTPDAIMHHGVVEAGVAYIQKPVTPTALSRKVREVLDG